MNPSLILNYVCRIGRKICLPSNVKKNLPLSFRLWKPGNPLLEGSFYIQEPLSSSPLEIPTHLLIPLLSFDDHGNRLGYGLGCYDRTLRNLRKHGKILAIGLAFEIQRSRFLPSTDFDEPLDLVITEKKIYKF